MAPLLFAPYAADMTSCLTQPKPARLLENAAGTRIARWSDYYNRRRPRSALGDKTPDEAHAIDRKMENLAA